MRLFEPNPVYCLIRGAFRIFFRLYGSWRIIGHEHIPKSGPVIIISNHISYLDPPLMGSAVRRPVAYMGKSELFRGGLLEWVCRKLESYPVKQGTVDREALKETFDRLDKGWMIGLFPEGHRSDTGELQEFQPGLALIALKSRAPIIPAFIRGTYEMLPPGARRLSRRPISVTFGPQVDVSDLYDAPDRKAASAELLRRCREAVARLGAETLP